jgi:hypothetical protein
MSFVKSRAGFFKRAILNAFLGALSARPAAALLVTPFVHLYKAAAHPPSQDSAIADFTECAFTGYAPVALALPMLGPINPDPSNSGVHNEADFLAGAIVGPGETVLGYWIDDAAVGGVNLYFSEQLATPIPIAAIGDFVSLDVLTALPWQESLIT